MTCMFCRDKLHEPVQLGRRVNWVYGCLWVSVWPAKSVVLLMVRWWPVTMADDLSQQSWRCHTSICLSKGVSRVWSVDNPAKLQSAVLLVTSLSNVKKQTVHQSLSWLAIAPLMMTFDTRRVWGNMAPVTGDVSCVCNHNSAADLSYVCPSAAITGSTSNTCHNRYQAEAMRAQMCPVRLCESHYSLLDKQSDCVHEFLRVAYSD